VGGGGFHFSYKLDLSPRWWEEGELLMPPPSPTPPFLAKRIINTETQQGDQRWQALSNNNVYFFTKGFPDWYSLFQPFNMPPSKSKAAKQLQNMFAHEISKKLWFINYVLGLQTSSGRAVEQFFL
jgi:hypothetical protein